MDGIPSDDFFRQYVSGLYKRKITKNKLVEEFKKHYFKTVLEVDKLGEYNYIHGVEDAYEPNTEDDEQIDLNYEDSNILEDLNNGSTLEYSNDRVTIQHYIKEIVKAAHCYSKIWNVSFENKRINDLIAELKAIRSFPSFIFLMHYLQNDHDIKNKVKVLKMIGTLMLRRHMTGQSTAYNDRIFAKLLRLDFNSPYIELIKKEFLEVYPEDDEFMEQFPQRELKNRNLDRARYILTKIENYITGRTNELKINGPDEVHIEHIIPQKISPRSWKQEFGDWEVYLGHNASIKHKKKVHLIGNLTLLSGELNQSASNNPFTRKKKCYRKSNIKLTQDLSEKSDFKFRTLDNRGKELAEIAVKIWRL